MLNETDIKQRLRDSMAISGAIGAELANDLVASALAEIERLERRVDRPLERSLFWLAAGTVGNSVCILGLAVLWLK